MEYTTYKQLQEVTFVVLGGQCAACGSPDKYVFQIDHIHNDGKSDPHRGDNYKMYGWIVNHPKQAITRYQILCANCHCLKHRHKHEFDKRLPHLLDRDFPRDLLADNGIRRGHSLISYIDELRERIENLENRS